MHRPPDGDYQQQLGDFISTWSGRLHTLADDPSVQICCDLTGGLDSRAVLALLIGAIHGCDSSIGNRLQIRSGAVRGARKDRSVAAEICRHFGLALNGRQEKKAVRLSGQASYALWKDLCMAVYHPIYFPNTSASGYIVELGGGGGENHRPFYDQFLGAPSADTFVSRRARNIAQRSARPGFEAALRQTIDSIMDGSPAYPDALTCHYRQFRSRFHAGRRPQYAVKFLPLASKMLDSVTAVAGESRYRSAQVHYDILHNLAGELLDIPFDSWRKRPGRRVRQGMTFVKVCPRPSGTCFIDDVDSPPAETKKGKETVSAIDHLIEDFHSANPVSPPISSAVPISVAPIERSELRLGRGISLQQYSRNESRWSWPAHCSNADVSCVVVRGAVQIPWSGGRTLSGNVASSDIQGVTYITFMLAYCLWHKVGLKFVVIHWPTCCG